MLTALVYTMVVCFVGECGDITNNNIIMAEAFTESQQETYMVSDTDISAQVSWWKAGLSEYTIVEEEALELPPVSVYQAPPVTSQASTSVAPVVSTETVTSATTTPTTQAQIQSESPSSEQSLSPAPKYASETFTVYDQNSGSYVTLNGYEMLCRIVRNEVGAHYTYGEKNGQTVYDEDAIKAFTIAAYSMLKYCKKKGETPTVGLNSNVSQALRNYVAEVDGMGAYYNGSHICAVYCASTGGTTLSSKNSWGTANPYLVSVESKYDNQGKQYVTTQVFSKQEMKNIIEAKTGFSLSNNPENWFVIASTIDGNYVQQLIIDGNSTCNIRGKDYRITGTFFRNSIMGVSKLKSPDFTVQYKDGYFYFTVYGYGHGVGMSAEGAQLYATIEGWDYRQILTHYYTGIEVY